MFSIFIVCFVLIFVLFVYIDRQGPLESLALSVILNQIQMFAMKLEKNCSCAVQFSEI